MKELIEKAAEYLDWLTSSVPGPKPDEVKELVAKLYDLAEHFPDAGKVVPEGWKLVPVGPTGEMILELMVCGLRHAEYKKGCSPTVNDMVQGYKAMLAAAPDVQREPVGWQCVWPCGGTYTTDSYESAKNYQEGAISSHGEDQAPFIRPLFDAPQPAPDVSALVEALEDIAQWSERWAFPGHPVATIARKALAAHRNPGGES